MVVQVELTAEEARTVHEHAHDRESHMTYWDQAELRHDRVETSAFTKLARAIRAAQETK